MDIGFTTSSHFSSGSLSDEEPMDIDPDTSERAVRSGNQGQFNGHKLSIATSTPNDFNKIQDAVGNNCAICFEPVQALTETPPAPLSVLNCYHVYHKGCIDEALSHDRKCPECRAPVSRDGGQRTYTDMASLTDTAPQECSEAGCEVHSQEQAALFACPYPLSTFTHRQPESFLEGNKDAIIQWLTQLLAEKHCVVCDVRCTTESSRSRGVDRPLFRIQVDYQTAPDKPPHTLFYSSNNINNHHDAEACINALMSDVHTDMAMIDFQSRYPGVFMPDTDLHIVNWDFYEDRVYTNLHDRYFTLSSIIDPSTKRVNLERLKQAMLSAGLDSAKLLKADAAWGTGRFVRQCSVLRGRFTNF